ncbi:hypothetical protein BFP97_05490 [Roseivirga sp. 4D4]|uniref:PAS domain-containing sensor histidine kinase n=1 Tax=Roseivirga sp. 4D4 TaxID=1889784 RepID=UPI000853807D|nr:PAS domain-containing sensor histidine kinase [Roseivirga sp. 4D4]OEK00996.1 hypothetical protein BFP97_05490 [Roseivirga sp. 4D4]
MPQDYIKDSIVFPLIFNCSVEGILVTNSKAEIVRINPSCTRIFGYTEEELIGKKIEVLIPEKFHERHVKHRENYAKAPQVRRMAAATDLYGLRKDATQVPLEISLTYIKHEKELFVLAFIVDVTDKRKLEKAKSLALVEGEENERRRIAQELHDGIGQAISSISLNLNALEPELEKFNHRFQEIYGVLKGEIENTMQEVRTISHNLTPRILEDYGLQHALEHLCATIDDSTDVELHLHFNGEALDFKDGIGIGLYRMIQEAVNNALRHGAPKVVNVHLTRTDHELLVLVEDDGCGFDVENTPKGLGMNNIESRAHLLKGEVHFDSNEQSGTTVSINIPI